MGIDVGPIETTDGLVFQLDAGNTRSYSGSGNTANGLVGGIGGTLVNGVGFGATNSGYFNFDGTNDYINVPSITSISGDFSVLVWFRTSTSNGNTARLVDFDYINGFWLGRSGGGGNPINWGGGIKESSDPYGIFLPFTDNEWHLISSVRSSTTHFIYKDNLIASTSNTVSGTALTSSQLFIGAVPSGAPFNGNIGQIQIYNRALSATEILQNYHATKGRYK
jgi:hypothetical protein